MTMKSRRQNAILQLIAQQSIGTQEELVAALSDQGFSVTQATVSRDIRELGLIKEPDTAGILRYSSSPAIRTGAARSERERFAQMFVNSVLDIQYANNIIVLRTLAGSANAAAEAVDGLHWPEILGTMAGDNTIFAVVRRNEEAPEIVDRLKGLLRGK